MIIKIALLKVSELLKKAEIKGFQRESAMILAEILDKSIEEIYAHPEYEISEENFQKLMNLVKKRASGMPMAYVLGKKDFFGLEFKVNSNVLIPRPETEMMVEEAIEWTKSFEKKDEKLLVLDIGTGSGCIPISIAKNIENKDVEFFATDISEKALKVAKENARIHEVEKRINFIKSDLLKSIDCSMFQVPCSVLITANLPYLSKEIHEGSPASVKNFEPKEALISGDDGLDHYRRLFNEINTVILNGMNEGRVNEAEESFSDKASLPADPLTSLGMTKPESLTILLEISPEQKELIEGLIEEKFGNQVKFSIKKDLAGKYRLVIIKTSCLATPDLAEPEKMEISED